MSQRDDIIQALRLLSDGELHQRWQQGSPTWPGVTDAVNWLIDDTWLDSQPATRLIPTVLGNDAEASSVGTVARALLIVIDDLDDSLGPGGYSDQQMIAHPGWPEVAARAKAALAVLS